MAVGIVIIMYTVITGWVKNHAILKRLYLLYMMMQKGVPHKNCSVCYLQQD